MQNRLILPDSAINHGYAKTAAVSFKVTLASCLARNGLDWYQLLELMAASDVLINAAL